MDTKIRLGRKPLTTVLWVLLTAGMALLLTVGAAMMYSSGSLTGILDEYHTSIAVRTDRPHWKEEVEWSNGEVLPMTVFADKTFTEEDVAWFESLACVEEVYFNTLTAAYSPELVPAIDPATFNGGDSLYSGIVIVGEITEITAELDYSEAYDDPSWASSTMYGTLRLEEIAEVHTGFARRTEDSDEYLNFEITLPDEYLEEFQVGRRYVLVGTYDPWATGIIISNLGIEVTQKHPWFHGIGYFDVEMSDGLPINIECYGEDPVPSIPYIKQIEGTLEEFLADPENAGFVQAIERTNRQNHGFVVLGTENVNAMHSFVAQNAAITDGRAFTEEEYASGARVCMLNESVAKSSGIQVGDTITLEQYLCQNTEDAMNLNPSLDERPFDGMQNNPQISQFSIHTEYAPAESFTVVGLYRLSGEWADNSYSFTPNTILVPQGAQLEGAYGGMSQSSTILSKVDIHGDTATYTDYTCEGTYGIYFSIKLKNGMVGEFEDLMDEDERFKGEFLTVDQGFGDVMNSLKEISAATGKLTAMVAAGWVLLLILYVLLYQGSQRKNIGIMRSLGTGTKKAADYLFRSGMAVAALGVALGTAASGAVMGAVQSKLMDSAISQLPSKYSNAVLTDEAVQMMATRSQLPIWAMLLLAAAQIAVFALVLMLHAKHTASRKPRALLR